MVCRVGELGQLGWQLFCRFCLVCLPALWLAVRYSWLGAGYRVRLFVGF